jgi:hypothetical protein
MTSQSVYNQTDRNIYNNQLSDYFSALANARADDVAELSKKDEQDNEILRELSIAGSGKLLDTGVHGVQNLVARGVQKVGQKGLELGKEYGKQAVSKLAERAGIPEQTVRDMLDGKLDSVKTVNQAIDYIKNKAQELGSAKVAELRGATGSVTDAMRGEGEGVADTVARAMGAGDGALNNAQDRLSSVLDRASQFNFQPLPDVNAEKEGADFFSRMGQMFGGKPVRPAGVPLTQQAPKPVQYDFTDPFTGKSVDLRPKVNLPDSADITTDAGRSIDGLTSATDASQLAPRATLERFRVLPGRTGAIRPDNLTTAQLRTRELLDNENLYQEAVAQKAQDLGTQFGSFKPPTRPTNAVKADINTANLPDLEALKAVDGANTAPGYQVLADVLKQSGSELNVPGIDELNKKAILQASDIARPDVRLPDVGLEGETRENLPSYVSKKRPTTLTRLTDNTEDLARQDSSLPSVGPTLAQNQETLNPVFGLGLDDTEISSGISNPFADKGVQDIVEKRFVEGYGPDKAQLAQITEPDTRPLIPEPDAPPSPKPLDVAKEEADVEAKEGAEKGGEDLGELIEKGLAEGGEEDVASGGPEDLLGDTIGTAVALGTIFGGIFGQKGEPAPPPLPNFSNPSVPVGI